MGDGSGNRAHARPNVLFLAVDSLRADAVFSDAIRTPVFDSLAGSGAAFTQCIATATTTTPSFASMLTGCFPPRHGVRGLVGYKLDPEVATMAEVFSAAGYSTHAEVTGPLLPETGVFRGFDDVRHRPKKADSFFGWRDEMLSKMDSYPEPWLMLLHLWEVHSPYRSAADYPKEGRIEGDHDRNGYERAVAATDEHLKGLFEHLDDNTIVLVTGDHGEIYPQSKAGVLAVRAQRKLRKLLRLDRWARRLDHRLTGNEIGHGFSLVENLIRVPLILSGPGISSVSIDQQVRHVDMLPTLADLCGVDLPERVDGQSLVPLMKGRSLPEEPAYLEAVGVRLEGDRIVGARSPEWKVLQRASDKPVLYKLDANARRAEQRRMYRFHRERAEALEGFIERTQENKQVTESGMTPEEEEYVEGHLKDLGYIDG